MAYTSGSTILDDDYNIFATGNASGTGNLSVPNINAVWGEGATDKGYGQPGELSSVSVGTTVTATQWESLLNLVETAAAHQGTTINSPTGSYPPIVVGNTISILSQLSTDITNVYNNRGNAVASGTDITTNGTTTSTQQWQGTASVTQTITFNGGDPLDWFFNAGGMIRLSWSRSGGTNNNKNTEWSDLLSKAGTIVITGGTATQTIAGVAYTGTTKIGGGGSTSILTTTTGAHDLVPTVPVTIFKQFADTSPYTTNYIEVILDINIAQNIITVVTNLVDDSSDIGPLDLIDGTLTQTMVVRPPSTTYLTDVWSPVTMSAASWTFTARAAPTLVASSLTQQGSITTTILSITKPTGTTTGDLMIAFVGTRDEGAERTWTGPAGWTEIYDETASGSQNGPDMAAYYKVANASEAASYSFTCSGSEPLAGAIVTYRNGEYGNRGAYYFENEVSTLTTIVLSDGALPLRSTANNAMVVACVITSTNSRSFTLMNDVTLGNIYSNVASNTVGSVGPCIQIWDAVYTGANINVQARTIANTGTDMNMVAVSISPKAP